MRGYRLHRYGVRARPLEGGLLTLEAPGKPILHVATASAGNGRTPIAWSPEELLTGSLATCFASTLVALADDARVPLHATRVDATGHLERKDERDRLILIELDVSVETDPGRERDVEDIAATARERCVVANALDVPIRTNLGVRPFDVAAA